MIINRILKNAHKSYEANFKIKSISLGGYLNSIEHSLNSNPHCNSIAIFLKCNAMLYLNTGRVIVSAIGSMKLSFPSCKSRETPINRGEKY